MAFDGAEANRVLAPTERGELRELDCDFTSKPISRACSSFNSPPRSFVIF
jgi:hypothetical protein